MKKSNKAYLIFLLIIVVLAFGCGAQYNRYRQAKEAAAANMLTVIEDASAPLGPQPIIPDPLLKEPEPNLAVHVKGAVEKPGLYELPAGSRVADALAMAGLLPEANTDIINLAAPLSDAIEVVVPFAAEDEETDWEALAAAAAAAAAANIPAAVAPAASSAASPAPAGSTSAGVNINRAGLSELQTLSGIGPVKAQAMIDYREQHGPFARIDDIKKVSGIGPATFDNIKNRITVD